MHAGSSETLAAAEAAFRAAADTEARLAIAAGSSAQSVPRAVPAGSTLLYECLEVVALQSDAAARAAEARNDVGTKHTSCANSIVLSISVCESAKSPWTAVTANK